VALTIVVMGLNLLAAVSLPGPAAGQGPIKAELLKREDFDRLPDQQEIEVQGQKTTAGEVRARAREQAASAEAKAKQGASDTKSKFDAARTRFLQDQKASVEAANARARAQSPRSKAAGPTASPQFQAIRQEAIQLNERSKTASPAERAQIEARAAELLGKLQQIGVAVPSLAQETQPAKLVPATPIPPRPAPGRR
jgi:hypothetical protein